MEKMSVMDSQSTRRKGRLTFFDVDADGGLLKHSSHLLCDSDKSMAEDTEERTSKGTKGQLLGCWEEDRDCKWMYLN